MKYRRSERFSTMDFNLASPAIFQEKHVPKDTSLIGMSALVHCLNVEAPVRKPSCVSAHRSKQAKKDTKNWWIFDSKYAVENTVMAHLVFAIRHEDLDLLVLKRIFMAIPAEALAAYVQSAPSGPLVRKIWFLYEYLTEKILEVPDSGKVTNVDLLDGEQYFVTRGTVSIRHRVRNNLLGTRRFCPVIRRTVALNIFIEKQFSVRAQQILSEVSPVLIARAASFLLLADTQASFAIEGERLPITSTSARWLKAVQQAGEYPLSKEELNRLHSILVGDYRYLTPGPRADSVFLGKRTTDNEPLPEFIGARPQDLDDLIDGLTEANSNMSKSALDAVLQAAAIAFGFVYIHPFEDGNGRLHRCLIHHTLAEMKFSPPGLVFPISSVTDWRQVFFPAYCLS